MLVQIDVLSQHVVTEFLIQTDLMISFELMTMKCVIIEVSVMWDEYLQIVL